MWPYVYMYILHTLETFDEYWHWDFLGTNESETIDDPALH